MIILSNKITIHADYYRASSAGNIQIIVCNFIFCQTNLGASEDIYTWQRFRHYYWSDTCYVINYCYWSDT